MFFLLTLPFRIVFGLFFWPPFLPSALLFLPFLSLRIVTKSTAPLPVLPFPLLPVGWALPAPVPPVIRALSNAKGKEVF